MTLVFFFSCHETRSRQIWRKNFARKKKKKIQLFVWWIDLATIKVLSTLPFLCATLSLPMRRAVGALYGYLWIELFLGHSLYKYIGRVDHSVASTNAALLYSLSLSFTISLSLHLHHYRDVDLAQLLLRLQV